MRSNQTEDWQCKSVWRDAPVSWNMGETLCQILAAWPLPPKGLTKTSRDDGLLEATRTASLISEAHWLTRSALCMQRIGYVRCLRFVRSRIMNLLGESDAAAFRSAADLLDAIVSTP